MPGGKQPYAIARRLAAGARQGVGGLARAGRGGRPELRHPHHGYERHDAVLHERMPVLLEPADWPLWLGEVEGDAQALLRPAGDGVLELWPVSRAMNSVRNNKPDLLNLVDDSHAPPPSEARLEANPT